MNKTKADYAARGSSVIQAGYVNAVFALPIEVKKRLDKLLGCGYSPIKVLQSLSHEFPNIHLPSKSALYVYKNKYLGQTVIENNFDEDKVKVKALLLTHVKRFLAVDLSTIRSTWQDNITKAQKTGIVSKQTTDTTKLYLEALKLCTDLVP